MKEGIEFSGGYIHGHDEERTRESHMEIFEYETGFEIPKLARKCGFPIRREYLGRGSNCVGSYPIHSYYIKVKSALDFAKKIKKSGLFPKTCLFTLAREIKTDRMDYRGAKTKPPKFFGKMD